jgi:hypothetical protein
MTRASKKDSYQSGGSTPTRRETLTKKDIEDLLRYEPDTGLLYWRVPKKGRRLDMPAGTVYRTGSLSYRQLVINYTFYLGHRIAWLLYYGEWPRGNIDHINGDGLDNRIDNLRDVDCHTNAINSRAHRNNECMPNIQKTKHNTWCARVMVNKIRYTKTFLTLEEARQYIKDRRNNG